MNKEMKNKMNEVLKEHGMRELSLDEMDRVSGGELTLFGHNIETPEDVNAVRLLAEALEQQLGFYGKEMVMTWIAEETKDPALLDDYRTRGLDGLSQRLSSLLGGASH